MANRTAFCRVCGKEFVPCGKSSAEMGAFNYREVACSPECGQEYLRRVLAGRDAVAADSAQKHGEIKDDILLDTEDDLTEEGSAESVFDEVED